jgi:hypothetical protein
MFGCSAFATGFTSAPEWGGYRGGNHPPVGILLFFSKKAEQPNIIKVSVIRRGFLVFALSLTSRTSAAQPNI